MEGTYVVSHEHQHEEERQKYRRAIQQRPECAGGQGHGRPMSAAMPISNIGPRNRLYQITNAPSRSSSLLNPPPRDQPRFLRIHIGITRPLRTGPAPTPAPARLLPLRPQVARHPPIQPLLHDAEVLIQHPQGDDNEEREEEGEVGADVPGGEHDACVLDLGVPALQSGH